MREVPEWIGKTDDAVVPDRVKLRIWTREDGRCHITGRKIMPGDVWELDHIKSLSLGGEHRESNLAPALYGPHKAKSAEDRALQAKSDRIRKRHLGIRKSKGRPLPGTKASGVRKRMNGQVERW